MGNDGQRVGKSRGSWAGVGSGVGWGAGSRA